MKKTLYHLDCKAPCEFIGDPEVPPDPDRHGNRRLPYKCTSCGERASVLWPPNGGNVPPVGFAYGDEIDWLIPLGE